MTDKCPSCTFQRISIAFFREICRTKKLRCSLSPVGTGRHWEAAINGRDAKAVARAMIARFKLARTRASGDGSGPLSPIILCNPHCPTRIRLVSLLTKRN